MKVSQAKICLSCDEVYTGQCCPICLERKFACLRDYFQPMISSQEVKEAIKNGTYPDSLQMVTKKKCADHLYTRDIDLINECNSGPFNQIPPASQPGRPASYYINEPSAAKVSAGNHSGGIRMEAKGGIKQRSSWIDAGIAGLWAVLRGAVGPRFI
jgi:hypothetical protein